jgi:hypothetical protein
MDSAPDSRARLQNNRNTAPMQTRKIPKYRKTYQDLNLELKRRLFFSGCCDFVFILCFGGFAIMSGCLGSAHHNRRTHFSTPEICLETSGALQVLTSIARGTPDVLPSTCRLSLGISIGCDLQRVRDRHRYVVGEGAQFLFEHFGNTGE